MRTSIIHGNGTLFLIAPQKMKFWVEINAEDSFLYKHKLGNKLNSIYRVISYIANDERLVAFTRVKPNNIDIDLPLYINC